MVTPFLFKLLRIINLPTSIYSCFLCCHCLPFSHTLPIIPILDTLPIFILVIVIVFVVIAFVVPPMVTSCDSQPLSGYNFPTLSMFGSYHVEKPDLGKFNII